MAGIEKDGNILFECKISREDLKNDDELILTALKTCLRVLELANDRILNDRSLFESLLKRDGLLLRYCGEYIKNDKPLIEIALKQNIQACKFVPSELVNEKLDFVATDGLLFKYFPDYNSNRNIVISAAKQNGFHWNL